jgi:membrane-bound serine protease (ClpP class)
MTDVASTIPAMGTRPWVRRLVAATALCLVGPSTGTQSPASARPLIVTAEYDGIIHPIATEYIVGVIDSANASGATLIVLTLRTPGGLLDSTQDIVAGLLRSRAPVVMFVGPSSARAASAGFILMMAADIAVMAPGTHIGAAHPVSGSGTPMDDTTSKKAASDAAAYVRSLAEKRGRNVMLAELAVTESRAFTDNEAASATPPLIDFVAHDVADLLTKLDGRTIARFDGGTTIVHTAGAELRPVGMTGRQRFLGGLAHPQIAFLLLTLGTLGLTIELWSPGAILPGVAGGLCLLLAFFALQILPVSATGLLLMLFGVALLILEVKVPSFGALGIGGAISLILGSMLTTRQVPGVEVSLRLIIPVVVAVAALGVLLGRLALHAQRQPAATGAEAMVGMEGRARTSVAPNVPGLVDVHGEIWRAISQEPVDKQQRVRILEVRGLTLVVEPTDAPRHGDST